MPAVGKLAIACLSLAVIATPCCSRAADRSFAAAEDVLAALPSAREPLRERASRLETLLAVPLRAPVGLGPDWLRALSRHTPLDPAAAPDDSLLLVVQKDRPDGTDLVTLRYPMVTRGGLTAYAGAGLNRTVYYAESPEPGTTALSGPTRHRSLGAAAQVGAALRVGSQLTLNADVRWAELNSQAAVLLGADGPVSADPVTVGLSLGWRFP